MAGVIIHTLKILDPVSNSSCRQYCKKSHQLKDVAIDPHPLLAWKYDLGLEDIAREVRLGLPSSLFLANLTKIHVQ